MQDVREIPNIDEIKKNIRKYFDDYCAAYEIDDMRSQRQPVFNGAMQYIYNNYIRPIVIYKGCKAAGYFNIAFCPMCGRKLVE